VQGLLKASLRPAWPAVRAREKTSHGVVHDAGRGFSASGPSCAFTYLPQQGKAAARLKQAIDSRSASLPETLAGQLAGLPCTTPASLFGALGEKKRKKKKKKSRGTLRPPSPAPFGLDLVVVE